MRKADRIEDRINKNGYRVLPSEVIDSDQGRVTTTKRPNVNHAIIRQQMNQLKNAIRNKPLVLYKILRLYEIY